MVCRRPDRGENFTIRSLGESGGLDLKSILCNPTDTSASLSRIRVLGADRNASHASYACFGETRIP